MRAVIDKVTRSVLVFLSGLLVIDVVLQVFSRYILQSPSTFTDELARFLLIWVSLLGAAYASGKKMHLSIEVLSNSLSPDQRRKLGIFINILIIAFVLSVLVIGGSVLVYYTYIYSQITPILQIPVAYVYLITPLSGLLIIYYKISNIRLMYKSTTGQIDIKHD